MSIPHCGSGRSIRSQSSSPLHVHNTCLIMHVRSSKATFCGSSSTGQVPPKYSRETGITVLVFSSVLMPQKLCCRPWVAADAAKGAKGTAESSARLAWGGATAWAGFWLRPWLHLLAYLLPGYPSWPEPDFQLHFNLSHATFLGCQDSWADLQQLSEYL